MKWFKKKDNSKLLKEIESLKSDVAMLKNVLPRQMQELAQKVAVIRDNGEKTANMNQQVISFLGDGETRFEALKTILIRNDLISSNDDFENVLDEIKGLRVKSYHELIESGDFVRIDFQIRKKSDGSLISEEKNFPVRLGSGQLVIEDKLIGASSGPDLKSFQFTYPKDSGHMANETVLFNVWVKKVKTKMEASHERH